MPDGSLDDLRKAGILGNTTVSPDGKDMLSSSAPAAAGAAPSSLGSLCSLGLGGSSPSSVTPKPLDLSSASEVVVLQNMVTEGEVANGEEMAEILDDTKAEASKHGRVLKCLCPKPGSGGPPSSAICAENIKMRVYVRFETAEAAVACAKELHGKMFDKRTVAATFISPLTFDAIAILPCHAA